MGSEARAARRRTIGESNARAARRRTIGGILAWILSLSLAFLLYLLSGRYPKPGFTDPGLFFSDETARLLLFSLRLPRALGAMLLGAILGGSGAAFQTLFGNPLVEAGFLGVSQGAAFGAALALVAGLVAPAIVAGSAFAFSLAALAASVFLSRRFRFGGQVLRLVLAGLAVSAFFSSLLAALKYTADPLSQLPDIVFWTMGSLTGMDWERLAGTAPVALSSLILLFLARWRITLLSMDDEVSRSLGLRPELERGLLIAIAAVGVAALTAVCGIVSWVGLVVPQVARILAGSDGRASIPASMAGGALFVLAADGLARSLFPGELPLGIVTAFLGAAAFCAVLISRRAELAR
jgi:iron complex transport system permease protein